MLFCDRSRYGDQFSIYHSRLDKNQQSVQYALLHFLGEFLEYAFCDFSGDRDADQEGYCQ